MARLCAIAGESFPQLKGAVAISNADVGEDQILVTMPSHTAGDLLLVVVSADGNTNINAQGGPSSDFVRIADLSTDTSIAVFALLAASSAEVLIVDIGAGQAIAHAYAISGASGNVEATVANAANPPLLTASWGQKKNLWVVGAACAGTVGNPPSGFGTATQTTFRATAKLLTCFKEDEVASLDPANTSATTNPSSVTIVVEPI